MRKSLFLAAVLSGVSSQPLLAAAELKFGKAPDWVVPQAIPPAGGKGVDRPVAFLLHDQQVNLAPAKIITYSELAFKIQKPEGLAAGNLSLSWDPATETATVNKLEVHRGDKIIDVLAGGQKFTTARRETNLDWAMLDGVLTANIQPEGLQEGDTIVLATTTEHADPVLKSHVETIFAPWTSVQVEFAHARLTWPNAVNLRVRTTGPLPTVQQGHTNGGKTYDLSMRDVEPVIGPKAAPVRFRIGRMGEATDFASWSDAAALMIPLYRSAAVIPAAGPLRGEVEKIRSSSTDPKLRAQSALQLVQDRIRYVALSMGQGGLVPADAATTWERRFGDCKAKTVLLLAMLKEFDVEAEPVAVNTGIGDAIADRLPMIGLFNHVLVRAHIGGKTYWLDGTRSGDTSIGSIAIPDFGWGLPLVPNAELTHIVPQPLANPSTETNIAIDASTGIYAPANLTVTQVIRGDPAAEFNTGLANLSDAQRKEFFDRYWKKIIDDQASGLSSFSFDKTTGELRLAMEGKLKLDWTGGFFHLPLSSLGYTPDLDRPEGPLHDPPVAVSHPIFTRTETKLRLPTGFLSANVAKLVPQPVHQTLIGVEYSRVQTADANGMTVQTMTRSLVPEVSYKDAMTAGPALKALSYGDVSVRLPATYRATAADVPALKTDVSADAPELVTRGNSLMLSGHFDDAAASFTKALELDPKNAMARADRGIAYAWMSRFDLAQKDLDGVAAIDPDNAIALRGRGLRAELMGNCASAVASYTESLRHEAGNSFALAHRAYCEERLLQVDAALADSAEALKTFGASTELRLFRANIFFAQGKRELAQAEADAMPREDPKSTDAWVAAAKIYAAIDEHDAALRAFDQALAIKPYAYIYINRAEVRAKSDVAGQLADLDAALKLEPGEPNALAAKAKLLANRGDFSGALALLDGRNAHITEEASFRAREEIAVALYIAGRTADAAKLFVKIRAGTSDPTDLNSLCWTKATAGILLDSALQDCRDALSIKPDHGAYLDSLGMVLLKLGRLDEALDAYNRAVAKGTGAESLMGRALVYARRGDQAHAVADAAAGRKLSRTIDDIFADYGLKFDQPTALSGSSAPAQKVEPTKR